MKICIWTSKIFTLGGTKRVVTVLANELIKEHDVTIMTYQDRFRENRNMYHMSEDINVDFIDNNDFISRRWTPASWFRDTVLDLNEKHGIFNKKKYNHLLANSLYPRKVREKWIKYLNEQDYDIIIATGQISLRLAMLAPYLKAKTVGWQHNCYSGYIDVPGVAFWKQECLLQEYLPKLDKYIVLSEYDKRDYKEKLNIDTEVKINPRSFVSEKKCNHQAKRFFMATRFVYAKGLDLMMEAFEKFCRQDDEWELDIIGTGELQDEIIEDAGKRKIDDRINFIGYSMEPEKYYLNSSVFLLPSRWEGWPMVIMEAFEFGLPVIAFHTGAMDLIIDDEKTGFLPEAFDTDAFAEAMLKLAHDDELRRRMSENAIQKSEDFDVKNAVRAWDDLFARLKKSSDGSDEFSQKYQKQIRKFEDKYPLRSGYAGYIKNCPVEDKTILYEAFGGRGMICNPYAVFCAMLKDERYRDYTHVWVIDDFGNNAESVKKYESYPNVKFVKYKSEEYCRALAVSKYLINNVSFPGYFLKREEQVYLNTWHGTPLKNMGFDIPGANVTQGNTARNLLSADYILSSGSYMTELAYRKSYKMENIYKGTILEEGFPRNDVLFQDNRQEIIDKLKNQGIAVEENKKIVLYAPTWKGDKYSDPDTGLDDFREVVRLADEKLNTEEYQILVKPHQIVYHYMLQNHIDPGDLKGKIIPAIMDTNEILSVTDVLISDYSSIFFDFLAVDRPIIFYVPDLAEFKDYRGLYYEMDRLPGPVVSSSDKLGELFENIGRILPEYELKRQEAHSRICPNDDGQVSRRVIEAVFEGKMPEHCIKMKLSEEKISLLIYGGTLKDISEREILDRIWAEADYARVDITLIGDGASDPEVADYLDGLDTRVRVLYWKPSYPETGEEHIRHTEFMKSEDKIVPDELKAFYKRELRRIMGMSQFDYALILTDRKKFFPAMSEAFHVKKIFGRENWQEVLKLRYARNDL